MDMEDESGHDEKVLAVLDDPRFDHITELDHICSHLKKEIQHFFENYKKLEIKNGKQKWARVLGWGSKQKAIEVCFLWFWILRRTFKLPTFQKYVFNIAEFWQIFKSDGKISELH